MARKGIQLRFCFQNFELSRRNRLGEKQPKLTNAEGSHVLARKKNKRDGMSRLGTSRNVQWSAEGVTNSLCPMAHNLVTYPVSDEDILMKDLKKMKENFIQKNEKK